MSKLILTISAVVLLAMRVALQGARVEKIHAPGDMGPFTITGTNVVTQIAADGNRRSKQCAKPLHSFLTHFFKPSR
jgi:hypothetical protein